jgi:HEAT repeat protein
VLEVILARVRGATSSLEKVTALRAVANCGDDEAYPAVAPFIDVSEEEIRAAAVESLQLMRRPEADIRLAGILLHDDSPEVRLAATRAALLHPASPVLQPAVASAVRQDRDPYVRLGALRVLASWLPTNPSVAGVVEQVAQQDREEAIRKQARAALDPKSRGG